MRLFLIALGFVALALLPFAPGATTPIQKVTTESAAYWPNDP